MKTKYPLAAALSAREHRAVRRSFYRIAGIIVAILLAIIVTAGRLGAETVYVPLANTADGVLYDDPRGENANTAAVLRAVAALVTEWTGRANDPSQIALRGHGVIIRAVQPALDTRRCLKGVDISYEILPAADCYPQGQSDPRLRIEAHILVLPKPGHTYERSREIYVSRLISKHIPAIRERLILATMPKYGPSHEDGSAAVYGLVVFVAMRATPPASSVSAPPVMRGAFLTGSRPASQRSLSGNAMYISLAVG